MESEIEPNSQLNPDLNPIPNHQLNPELPEKSKSKIVIYIVLVFVLIVILGGAFYYYQKMSTPEQPNQVTNESEEINITDWQTYTSEDYYYALQYPLDWRINEAGGTTQILPPGNNTNDGKYSTGPALSLTYINQMTDDGSAVEASKVYINNIEVIKEISGDYVSYIRFYFPRPEGGFILISWRQEFEDEYPEFWQMTQSMKILEYSVSEWETYIDEDLGFSFSYPKLKWGNMKIELMEEEDHDEYVFRSGKAKKISFAKNPQVRLEAFSSDFSHMYNIDPYYGDEDLKNVCKQEGVLNEYKTEICKNINIAGQDTYEEIVALGYECSFTDIRKLRLNLDIKDYPGLLISQNLPSSQGCGTVEIESMNEELRTKDLTDQYNRKNLKAYDLENLELLDSLLNSFKFLDSEISSNIFDVTTVKIGDLVAGMEIISITPFKNSNSLSYENAKVKFSGVTEISGSYNYNDMLRASCITGIKEVLPKIDGDTRSAWLCFEDTNLVKSLTNSYQEGDKLIVNIDGYTINSFPGEVANMAELVVIK